MKLRRKISNRIKKFHPKGGLGETATVILILLGFNHLLVQKHAEGLALLAEKVARKLKKDEKAAFFGALFHDIGKLVMVGDLFCGRNITAEEYEQVKKHAVMGFLALKDVFLFTALCAGLHHAMYEKGYGITVRDIPRKLGAPTVKKILEIAAILAICDDIDASLTRGTTLKDDSGKGLSLRERLEKKFPNDLLAVEIALGEAERLYKK